MSSKVAASKPRSGREEKIGLLVSLGYSTCVKTRQSIPPMECGCCYRDTRRDIRVSFRWYTDQPGYGTVDRTLSFAVGITSNIIEHSLTVEWLLEG